MKYKLCVLTLTVILSSFKLTDNNNIFKKLYSLQGTWIMHTKRGLIGESWQKINNNYLQSKGFFVRGTDTISNESVALTSSTKGIVYTSTIKNQNDGKPVDFKLTSFNEKLNTFIFENPEHDFPKRIIYELVSKDSLHAYIDGGVGAKEKREDFYYSKLK